MLLSFCQDCLHRKRQKLKTDPHVKLRENVKLLGSLLGKVIQEQESPEIYKIVEQVRCLSKEARSGNSESFCEMSTLLSNMDISNVIPVARSFAHFLNFANIAEQHHRIRRAKEYKSLGKKSQRASCKETFDYLIHEVGISTDELYESVCKQKVELVLTAHPTEVTRRTLIQKHKAIEKMLTKLDACLDEEKQEIEDELYREIICCWETDEIHRDKPGPADEAKWGFAVIENTLWDAVPHFLRNLDQNLQKFTGKQLPLNATPICFGSWMGGDRDGNPNVNHKITREVCWLARWVAADLYHKEIEALYSELSIKTCSAEMKKITGESNEPYRKILRIVRAGLKETRLHFAVLLAGKISPYSNYYNNAKEVKEKLMILFNSLHDTGLGIVADGRLLDIIRRLECFGLSLVKLDVRQESTNHTNVLDAITMSLDIGSYKEWNEEKRQEFLIKELKSKRPLIPRDFSADEMVEEVLDTFRVIAEMPSDSFGAYVISMASMPSDILAVALLQRELGVKNPMRVVPLFEKIDDLHGAKDTLDCLFSMDWYQDCIGGKQEIMIGYSDSAKDGGRLAAAWTLYSAQEQMVEICKKHNIQLTLFHGRGGTVGRGGGPTSLAILSQPPGSVGGQLRVTEQGEMINAKFNLPGIAFRTLEIYTTATLRSTLNPSSPPTAEWRNKMNMLSDISKQAYNSMVKENEQFVPYFRAATPEVELSNLNIGSRPKRRKKGGGVESLRAIPWIFAWTQTRLILPSWLGVGEGLRSQTPEDEKVLQEMYSEWPFFRALIDLIEMVLAKADIKIAEEYDKMLVGENEKSLGEELRNQFKETYKTILSITNNKRPAESNTVLRRSIDVRNPYVDPINILQIEILKRIRACNEEDSQLRDALLITFNGIAAGMRNTG